LNKTKQNKPRKQKKIQHRRPLKEGKPRWLRNQPCSCLEVWLAGLSLSPANDLAGCLAAPAAAAPRRRGLCFSLPSRAELSLLHLAGVGFIGRNLVVYLVENDLAKVRVADKVLPQTAYLTERQAKAFTKVCVCVAV
jgi:hypothetical protein